MHARVSLAPAGHVPRWSSELLGGATGAVVMLAVVITLGLLAYAPLGLAQAPLGVTASLATAGVGGLVFALAGGRGLPVSGPSSATALIFAGLLAQLVRDPQWQADPAGMLAPVLAVAGLAVSLAGVLLMVLGLLRLGRLAQYVPQPVLAGFMNGVSLLILLAQIPVLTGIGQGGFQPATLLLGLGTAAATWAVARRWPNAPAQLIGLGLGLDGPDALGLRPLPLWALGALGLTLVLGARTPRAAAARWPWGRAPDRRVAG